MTRHRDPPSGPGLVSVHVPVVFLDGAEPPPDVPLFRLVAGEAPVAPRRGGRDLQPHIEPLLDFGAYTAGLAACAAVSALALPRRWSRRPAPLVWPSVSVANQEPGRSSPLNRDTCRSADLGIALALVLGLTRHELGGAAVIATGQLDAPRPEARDAAVLPVGSLAAKFRLILRQLDTGAIRGPGWLFTPRLTAGGAPVAEEHAAELAAIAAKGIRAVPVDSLRDAVEALGATVIPPPPAPPWMAGARRAATVAAVAAVAGGAAWAGMAAHAGRPLALSAAADPYTGLPTPLRARPLSNRTYDVLGPCRAGASGREAVRAGETLLLRVDTGGEDPAGLHHTLVLVSETSGVKVYPAGLLDAAAGGALHYAIPVIEPPERGLVVVLAGRRRAFDGEAIRQSVRAAMDDAAPAERINAAANHLRALAPGFLSIPIEVVGADDPLCPSR